MVEITMPEKTQEIEESEFGRGLTYCLGLFLAHAERDIDARPSNKRTPRDSLWFNAAKDHLYEITIPDKFPEALKIRITDFRTKVMKYGYSYDRMDWEKEIEDALREAKDILIEIDIWIGVAALKGDWE